MRVTKQIAAWKDNEISFGILYSENERQIDERIEKQIERLKGQEDR